MNIPMILALVIFSSLAGAVVTATAQYVPLMILSAAFMAIGAGLLTTFQIDTNHPRWIGYQIIFGTGVGLGMQQTLIAVQAALHTTDVPIGTALMMFSQTLGGAIFVSVGQNVFTNQLIKNLAADVPEGGAQLQALVLATGASELKHTLNTVCPQFAKQTLDAYSNSLTQMWMACVALAVLCMVGVVCSPWISVKGKNIEMGGGA